MIKEGTSLDHRTVLGVETLVATILIFLTLEALELKMTFMKLQPKVTVQN